MKGDGLCSGCDNLFRFCEWFGSSQKKIKLKKQTVRLLHCLCILPQHIGNLESWNDNCIRGESWSQDSQGCICSRLYVRTSGSLHVRNSDRNKREETRQQTGREGKNKGRTQRMMKFLKYTRTLSDLACRFVTSNMRVREMPSGGIARLAYKCMSQ